MTAEARLTGRVALITGAGRGIGRAVALRFAAEGADLVLVGRTQGALEEVDDAVRALGRHAALVVADLGDRGVIDKMGAAVWERWGRLDVLVGNAASLATLTPVGHIDPKTWDEVIAVNLTANWWLLRSFDPLLRAATAGRAIFVTSGVAGGRGYWGAYAASKAGLEALVRTYADEIENTAVRANLIDPAAETHAYARQRLSDRGPPHGEAGRRPRPSRRLCRAGGARVYAQRRADPPLRRRGDDLPRRLSDRLPTACIIRRDGRTASRFCRIMPMSTSSTPSFNPAACSRRR